MVHSSLLPSIVITAILLVPGSIELYYYFKTRLFDYLLLSGVYLSTIFLFVANIMIINESHGGYLFPLKSQFIATHVTYFLMLIHVNRIRNSTKSKVLLVIGSLWFVTLMFLTLSWELTIQPDSINLLGIKLGIGYEGVHPQGASYYLGSLLLYSSSFRLLGDLFGIFVFGYMFYTYYLITPLIQYYRIIQARRLWLVAISLFLGSLFLSLPGIYVTLGALLPTILLMFAFMILTYVAVFIPEALIMSEVLIFRMHRLYDLLDENEDGSVNIPVYNIAGILSYLASLPQDLFTKELDEVPVSDD
ncbi:MAG: hypothetical protein ACXAE3_12435 [Candidatus Kariarchaeaceae archaeon]|jgi:hypothetical protein